MHFGRKENKLGIENPTEMTSFSPASVEAKLRRSCIAEIWPQWFLSLLRCWRARAALLLHTVAQSSSRSFRQSCQANDLNLRQEDTRLCPGLRYQKHMRELCVVSFDSCLDGFNENQRRDGGEVPCSFTRPFLAPRDRAAPTAVASADFPLAN